MFALQSFRRKFLCVSADSKFLSSHNYFLNRSFSSFESHPLVKKIQEVSKKKIDTLKEIKTKYGNITVGKYTPMNIIGGMRGMLSILTDTSQVNSIKGIEVRGYSIEKLQKILPKRSSSIQILPEALYWLLLTGEIPTQHEVEIITEELIKRRKFLSPHVFTVLDCLSKDTHPMSQLITAVSAMQIHSKFSRLYSQGLLNKATYWYYVLDDSLSLVACLPLIAAYIYRRSFHDGVLPEPDDNLDWSANLIKMMGFSSNEHFELIRLYLSLHADHEGGNVSAHASHLVGSALGDPYLCFVAAMTGLAAPLHGLSNQECLKWLLSLEEELKGEEPNEENVSNFAKKTLSAGKVIPGYGHAILRIVDPRFLAQQAFAEAFLPNDKLYKLMKICVKVIPNILEATGKVRNPYPNVDCHSGVLLRHYNIREEKFYTVLFGVSRALGVTSQLVWSRILGLPIERPGSITIDNLATLCKKSSTVEVSKETERKV